VIDLPEGLCFTYNNGTGEQSWKSVELLKSIIMKKITSRHSEIDKDSVEIRLFNQVDPSGAPEFTLKINRQLILSLIKFPQKKTLIALGIKKVVPKFHPKVCRQKSVDSCDNTKLDVLVEQAGKEVIDVVSKTVTNKLGNFYLNKSKIDPSVFNQTTKEDDEDGLWDVV